MTNSPTETGDEIVEPPTDRIAVIPEAYSQVPNDDETGDGVRRQRAGRHAALIAKVAAAAAIVSAIGIVVAVPDGAAVSYQTTGGPASSSATPTVAVPGAVLPNISAGVSAPVPAADAPSVGGVALGDATATTGTVPTPSTITGPTLGSGTSTATIPGLDTSQLPQQKPCSLGWPAAGPDQQGGLASMIGIAPAFGPFSSEAFALGSVYQPILQLAGPLLAEIEPVIEQNLDWLNPIIDQVTAVEALVLQAILPYYGPYRQQLLDAEVELGRALTPILQKFYASDVASCFVAWQAQIINRAKGKKIVVASLTKPGTVIHLGPKS